MARDTEELGTGISLTAELVEPVGSTTDDGRCDGNGLDVGDSAGAAEETDSGREWRLQTWLSGLAFEGLDEGGLLTTDIGTHATVEEDIEVVS